MTTKPPNPANPPASLLGKTIREQTPIFRKVLGFSLANSLLVLAPTIFMLEVYDRVVTSRSGTASTPSPASATLPRPSGPSTPMPCASST